MKTTLSLCVALLAGCSSNPSAWQTAMRAAEGEIVAEVKSAKSETITILRENTAALSEIKQQVESLNGSIIETRRAVGTMEATLTAPKPAVKEVIKSALEPQEVAKEPASTTPFVAAPAVRLFVTSSEQAPEPFPCDPCNRMQRAIDAGEFAEFEIVFSEPFAGQKSYPATRYQDYSGAWKVRYGYDKQLPAWIRDDVRGTNSFVSRVQNTKSFVSQSGLVSIQNSLNQYGIRTQSPVLVNRGSSCPNGNCPTPKSLRMRWK